MVISIWSQKIWHTIRNQQINSMDWRENMAKICANCGNKCGFLGAFKLGDNTIVCNSCCEEIAEKNGEEDLRINLFRHIPKMTFNDFQEIYKNPELASRYNTFEVTPITHIKEIAGVKFNDMAEEIQFPLINHGREKYQYSQLVQYEYFENQESVATGGSGIGRAIVGGMLFGGAGAIVGAVTKRKSAKSVISDMSVMFTFNVDGRMVIEKKKINDWVDDDIKPGSDLYVKYLTTARELMAKAEEICAKYHELGEDKQQIVSDKEISGADEIRKYKQLLDEGIISQEEFNRKKKQILGL